MGPYAQPPYAKESCKRFGTQGSEAPLCIFSLVSSAAGATAAVAVHLLGQKQQKCACEMHDLVEKILAVPKGHVQLWR